MNLKDLKKIYCVGIKGAGMTAIAQMLKQRNIEVIGSDTPESFYTDRILKQANIPVFENFAAKNIPDDVDLVVYSTAYSAENNVEVKSVVERKIAIMSYPQMLGELFKEKLGIAVCGTHGKTTTSAILAEALVEAGADPSVIVGGQVISWQGCSIVGNGDYFVAEADEYQNKLQYYNPWSVILTSVDWDHPDFFPNFAIYKQAFKDFVKKIPKSGFLIVWGDSVDTLEVAEQATCRVLTYGFGDDNIYNIKNVRSNADNEIASQTFEIYYKENNLGSFQTPLSGKHNILNCASVISLAHAMNLDLKKINSALEKFKGTTRRFEQIGKYNDALLIDDYAHHPDEIKATLSGARARFGQKRIWTVFHPHTFTRTKALLQDFAQSFENTDKVIIIDVYGSAREQQGGVSSQDLVNLINKYQMQKAQYIPSIEEAIEYFKETAGKYDVLITMGAGDVWKIAKQLNESNN